MQSMILGCELLSEQVVRQKLADFYQNIHVKGAGMPGLTQSIVSYKSVTNLILNLYANGCQKSKPPVRDRKIKAFDLITLVKPFNFRTYMIYNDRVSGSLCRRFIWIEITVKLHL